MGVALISYKLRKQRGSYDIENTLNRGDLTL
jgi:hypothetical protein